MISDRAKRLVEALKDWRSLELAYETAQRFLDEEAAATAWELAHGSGWEVSALEYCRESHDHKNYKCIAPPGYDGFTSERIAQTRGHDVSPTEGE